MKLFFRSLSLTVLALYCTAVQADLLDSDYGFNSVKMDFDPADDQSIPGQERDMPFTFSFDGDITGEAKFDKKDYNKEKVRFGQMDAVLGFVFLYNPTYVEGAKVSIGYAQTLLDWKQNPYFHSKNFKNMVVSLAGFTKRACGWDWKAYAAVNFNADHLSDMDYNSYDLFFAGRYDYNCKVGLHIGLLVLTGLKIDHVYPVFGFDWQYSPKIKINAVFPTNVSVHYRIDQNWQLYAAGRFFDVRQRVGKHAVYSEGLFEYTAVGGEVGVEYEIASWLEANLHGGGIGGGKLKIYNKSHHNRRLYRFNSAPYVGGSLTVNF